VGATPFSTANRHRAVRKRSQAKLAAQVRAAAGSSMASAATSAPGHPAADATAGVVGASGGILAARRGTGRGGGSPRLETRCRDVARPALALERLPELADGRVAYRVRHAWSDGPETLLCEPGTLIEQLVALGPRPNGHPTRFSGGLAPRSSWVEGRDRSSAGGQ